MVRIPIETIRIAKRQKLRSHEGQRAIIIDCRGWTKRQKLKSHEGQRAIILDRRGWTSFSN